jgi:hypothetical protein
MRLFDFGRQWRMALSPIVSDEDWTRRIGCWLNGRLAGRYVSLYLQFRPNRIRPKEAAHD